MIKNIKFMKITDRLTAFLEKMTYGMNFQPRAKRCAFARVTYILGKNTVSAVSCLGRIELCCQWALSVTVSSWQGINRRFNV